MSAPTAWRRPGAERLLPAAQILAGVLAFVYIVLGLAGLAAYWPASQEVCTLSADACQSRLQFTADQAAAFAAQGIPLLAMSTLRYLGLATGMLSGMLIGVLIYWRRRDDWMALLTVVLLVSYAGSNSGVTGPLTRAFPPLNVPVQAAGLLWILLFVLFLVLFPDGRVRPGWMLAALPLGIIVVFFSYSTSFLVMTPLLIAIVGCLLVSFFVLTLVGQIVRYRQYSTATERQQIKWALLGIGLMIVALISGVVFAVIEPFKNPVIQFLVSVAGFNLGPALLPIFLGIAILRSRLWDIDVIIRRTMIYGMLTGLLITFYFGSVVILQQLLRSIAGWGSDLAIIASTLAIFALSIPLKNRVQSAIDHRFYRRKYDAAQVLSTFAATVRDEVDLGRLTENLASVVEETMRPESVSVWLNGASERGRRTDAG